MRFKQDIDRDAGLVHFAIYGGFEAVCYQAMVMTEFTHGPDDVLSHAKWLKKQPKDYIEKVAQKVQELEEIYNDDTIE